MFCKNCGSEVDEKAVACPKCGVSMKEAKVKKSIFKRWWFWVVVAIVAVAVISGSSEEEHTPANTDDHVSVTQNTTGSEADTQETENIGITYEKIDLQTMLDELDANALKAERIYQDKYVEVVGKIKNFDSDGSYIGIEPVNADEWNFEIVMCMIESDEQLNFLLEKQVGDAVTVRGQITSIGEVLGFTIEIAEVQ